MTDPSGESRGAVSRKPRVMRRGGADPSVVTSHSWPVYASACTRGRVTETTARRPSGDTAGRETEVRRSRSVVFIGSSLAPGRRPAPGHSGRKLLVSPTSRRCSAGIGSTTARATSAANCETL